MTPFDAPIKIPTVTIPDSTNTLWEPLKKELEEENVVTDCVDSIHNFRRGLTDPLSFVEYCTTFSLDEYQTHVMNQLVNGEIITEVTGPRQRGMTTTVLLYFLWSVFTQSDKTVILGADTYENATRNLQTLRDMITNNVTLRTDLFKVGFIVNNTKAELLFSNGTRLLARAMTECSLRGMTISNLHVDNSKYVKNLDNIMHGVYPAMAGNHGSKIFLTSTG